MTPYLLVFASFLAVYFALEATTNGRKLMPGERWMLLLPLAIFSVVYAGRIGTDADQYSYLFDTSEEFPVEPGFSMLMTAAKSIGLDYIGFVKVLAIVQMLLLASIAKRLRDPLFFLLFYLSSFFLNFQFNAIRNSLALLILGAIFVQLRRPSLVALVSSSVIHFSSVITLGVQRLAVIKRQWLAMVGITIATALFMVLWFRPDLAGDQFSALAVYQGYLGQEYESKSVYPALLLKLVIVWFFYRNGGSRFYLVVYAIFVLLVHLVSPILSRVSDLVLFLALLDFCMRHPLQRYRLAAVGLTMVLVVSSLLIPWDDCQVGGTDNWCLSGPSRQ
jgi:hypothetical protein